MRTHNILIQSTQKLIRYDRTGPTILVGRFTNRIIDSLTDDEWVYFDEEMDYIYNHEECNYKTKTIINDIRKEKWKI